jgi:RND family efflux transporter MFP subunit
MKKGFTFKAVRVVTVLVLAVMIAILLITLRPKAKRITPKKTGVLVEILTVKAQDLNMIIETYGTVKPREILKLVAEVKGKIVKICPSFEEGGFIKKGAVLIKIDPRTYQLEVKRRRVQIDQIKAESKHLQQEIKNLEASINIAKSDVTLAQANFFRLKKLMSEKVVAQTTLDKTEQKYLARLEHLQGLENQLALTGPLKEKLKAQRDMARVLLGQAELDLERTSIVAPFDGWVLEKSVEVGLHVKSGQYLGGIYSAGALDIEVRIPVKDLKWLPPDSSPGLAPEAEIFLDSPDNPRPWKGHLARRLAKMDEKTRTLPVIIEVSETAASVENPSVENPGVFHLKPGMFVTVKIKGGKIEQVFVLPRHVIHNGDVVYIMQDNKLKIKPVNVLRRFKDSVFVDRGLVDGDLVISSPLSGATEGMKVRGQGGRK